MDDEVSNLYTLITGQIRSLVITSLCTIGSQRYQTVRVSGHNPGPFKNWPIQSGK